MDWRAPAKGSLCTPRRWRFARAKRGSCVYEKVAQILARLELDALLSSFEEHLVDDDALVAIEPDDLRAMGVEPDAALKILAAISDVARSQGAAKKLVVQDAFDGAARHQARLEATLQRHRAEISRLRLTRAEIPDDLRCPLTLELFLDPVSAADGHTYEVRRQRPVSRALGPLT